MTATDPKATLRIPKTITGKLRMTLIIIFGALPAAYLGFYAALLALTGVDAVVTEGDWYGLTAFVWGLAGVVGAFAIWRVALGYESLAAIAGLLVGIGAVCALHMGFETYQYQSWSELLLSPLNLPVYCAIYIIVEFAIRTRKFAIHRQEEDMRQ